MKLPPQSFRVLSFAFCGTLAVVSLMYVILRTFSPSGAIDFHSYWYAGHFIRQRLDPYNAFINDLHPSLPIIYLDGYVVTELPIAQPGLARVPANTALMVELLSVFSFFSWKTAKILWMICNLLISFVVPFLVIQMFPNLRSLSLKDKLLFGLIFISLFGTRNTLGNGQTSLLVFAMMLLAILCEEKWLVSGIALGIALSKYSLALPVLLIFIIEKKYRQVVAGILTQFFGLIILSQVCKEPIGHILSAYLEIAKLHINQPGIHLIAALPREKVISWLMVLIISAGTIISTGHYIKVLKTRHVSSFTSNLLLRPTLFNILMIWTLLVVYHRAYDTLVIIAFIGLVAELLFNQRGLSKVQQRVLAAIATWVGIVMVLPAQGITAAGGISSALMPFWLRAQSTMITLSLVIALGTSIWILYHFGCEKVKYANT